MYLPNGSPHSKLGIIGEEWFAAQLHLQGWHICARQFRRRGFEVDLIASKGHSLVAFEVKSRQHWQCLENAAQLVTLQQIARVQKGLAYWHQTQQQPYFPTLRVDLVVILFGHKKTPKSVRIFHGVHENLGVSSQLH